MKYIGIIVCLIFPLIGFSQAENEIKSMLTKRGYGGDSRYGVDSITQNIITENTWKTIYYYSYDKKVKDGKVTKANPSAVLTFRGEKFSYAYEGENILFLGDYSFDWKFLCTGFIDMGDYEIIDLIDNEYLIVEEYLPMGKNGAYKSTHRRLLYQRQNMSQADRIPSGEKAKQMFTEESYLTDTNFVSSSIEGVWKQIYTYEYFTKKTNLERITFENSVKFQDGKFNRNYPNHAESNDSGQYSINGVNLSFLSESGNGYSLQIINIFDNEYLVIERMCILKKNKPQRPILRIMLKRTE